MSFNEDELLKIKKATSGFFKKKTKIAVTQALVAIKPRIDAVKKLNGDKRIEALNILVNEATNARHLALQRGATSYKDPQWAAAAACESWLQELIGGTSKGIARVDQLIKELSDRS